MNIPNVKHLTITSLAFIRKCFWVEFSLPVRESSSSLSPKPCLVVRQEAATTSHQVSIHNLPYDTVNECGGCVTGELDRETAETMNLPRCGVRDKVGYASDSRSKRYALQGESCNTLSIVSEVCRVPRGRW